MTTLYAVAPDVLCEEVDGRVLLIDSGSSELITLNPVGSLVWIVMARGETTVAEVIEAVAEEHPTELRDQIAADVRAFVGELVEIGLVLEVAS